MPHLVHRLEELHEPIVTSLRQQDWEYRAGLVMSLALIADCLKALDGTDAIPSLRKLSDAIGGLEEIDKQMRARAVMHVEDALAVLTGVPSTFDFEK